MNIIKKSSTDLLLSDAEIVGITGFKHPQKQITILVANGIPHTLNGRGKPIVARAAYFAALGITKPNPQPQPKTTKWRSNLAS